MTPQHPAAPESPPSCCDGDENGACCPGPAAPETEGRVCEIVRVRCPHREGLAYRNGDTLTLLPCDCNDPSEVVGVVGVGVDLWDDVRRQRNEWRRVAVSRRTTALADCVGAGGCVRDDGDACADTPCNANPAAPETETDANGLTEAEREALTRCDCGHDIGGEHNSYGCYGSGPACGCGETDDRPGVNFAAVERIVTERLRVVEGERDAARGTHRDLVSRLGFGDNITEPMADNDTIVAWFERQSRDASEWQESQLWRNDCYAAGHPQDDDCHECDPRLALTARAESAEAAHAALVAEVVAALDDWTSRGPGAMRDHLRALLAGGGE